MSIHRLSDNLYISPQVAPGDAAEAAKLGIRSVICNRPDGEEAGQASAEQAAAWFADAGIPGFHHQPVAAPQITAEDARCFAEQLEAAEGPVLAYCRTGTRSSLLWAIGQVQAGRNASEVIAEVQQKTGLDLNPFAAKLTP